MKKLMRLFLVRFNTFAIIGLNNHSVQLR